MFGMIPAGLLPLLQMPNGKNVGVMADDVAKMRPDALGPKVDGLQTVNYQQLDKPKGGMFGGGDWKSALAAALAGFAAGGGNPAGQMALQMLQQRLGQKREDQQYEQRRKDALLDYAEKQKIEAQYQQPRVNDTVADYEFFKGQLGEDAAKDFLRSKTNPVVMTPYGPMPYSAVVPQQQAKPLTDEDIARMTQGGPAATPPATFPRPYY